MMKSAMMVGLVALSGPHLQAADVDVAIVFAVDASGSIDAAAADLQREGHAEAIRAPEVIAAIDRGGFGCIAIAYVEWASSGQKRTVMPWTSICGRGDAQSAAAFIRREGNKGNACRRRHCGTSISFAIDLGALLLDGYVGHASSKIIDISANGTNNDGLPVQPSRLQAINKGITINAIAVPTTMQGVRHHLVDYFAENVIGGTGAFAIEPVSTNDYVVALRRKMVIEISMLGNLPNQSSMPLPALLSRTALGPQFNSGFDDFRQRQH
ncbi:DUF1194 domain-containing protein [Mesorhizobium sp. A556]